MSNDKEHVIVLSGPGIPDQHVTIENIREIIVDKHRGDRIKIFDGEDRWWYSTGFVDLCRLIVRTVDGPAPTFDTDPGAAGTGDPNKFMDAVRKVGSGR